MSDLRDHDGLTRESFIIRMAGALIAVNDLNDAAARCEAYCRAGFLDEQIITHDRECKRRETIRRSISSMRERARAAS